MGLRHNHYDAAFEAYLRGRRTPYVFVDERRRALLEGASLKSMDFIVYSSATVNLLVDVKGRRYPSGLTGSGHKWENWTGAEDVPALLQWEQVFGSGFRGLLAFAYHVVDAAHGGDFDELFEFRGRRYAFFGVWADAYLDVMKTRSSSWDTVCLPNREFRRLRVPLTELL